MTGNSTHEAVPVLVIGAGIMGLGIAQVAAQAGHEVFLFDVRQGAAISAKTKLEETLKGLSAKGRISEADAAATSARVIPVPDLQAATAAKLAVEAIVEDLGAKRALLSELAEVLSDDAILATNTSSISVTAIANGVKNPGRVVGMHFFNPVPLMKLVEVVRGLQTSSECAEQVFDLAKRWGKVPVYAKSTPGFIVNRIARPYYAETLALLQEQSALPHELDACLVAAGFRMGPCALMDLIGHDTNFAVTQSVFTANFFDRRFTPSIVQRELVDGGLLGRKSGQGFYSYQAAASMPVLEPESSAEVIQPGNVVVHGSGAQADWLASTVSKLKGMNVQRLPNSGRVGITAGGLELVMTDGRCASELSPTLGAAEVAVFDRFSPSLAATSAMPLAYSTAEGGDGPVATAAGAWLSALGFRPVRLKDVPGLVVARTLATLINEAADAVSQGVCDEAGANVAMKLGVNYPQGPFEWLSQWDADAQSSAAMVAGVLDALDAFYRGERYRVSPLLRARTGRSRKLSESTL